MAMFSRATKLRFRRRLRVQRRQVEEFGAQAEKHLENNFFERLERLVAVRRFVTSWLLLVVLLIGCVISQNRALSSYYQTPQPIPGGTYTEGILGSFTNANPIYATSLVDSSVSRLLFASLFTYDQNNQLVGDLADGLSTDARGLVYTVHLKPKLTWHDGKPLTARDVVFTFQVIQNPDAHSPLFTSWQGIQVKALDPQTVTFTLANPLASFPYSLTTGLIPEHVLGKVVMADMRSIAFNSTNPVGAGPFQWQAIEVTGGAAEDREEQVALRSFANYHGGEPKLNNFIIRTFRDRDQLQKSFEEHEITAAVGLTAIPPSLVRSTTVKAYNMPLTAQVMCFFRVSQPPFNDLATRRALVAAIDRQTIIEDLSYPTLPVREPLLPGQPGYNPTFFQAGYDPAGAAGLLDSIGWIMGKDGYRHQGETRLGFALYVQDNSEYLAVARNLSKQWRAVGIKVDIIAQSETVFQSTLAGHSYEALLHGISVGTDPDVFPYWHGSQANVLSPVRLNISEYASAAADASLEAGRTRSDPALRAIKYQPFLQAWQADIPALGLYRARFLYLTHGTVYGLSEHIINADSERFANVNNWMVRTANKTVE